MATLTLLVDSVLKVSIHEILTKADKERLIVLLSGGMINPDIRKIIFEIDEDPDNRDISSTSLSLFIDALLIAKRKKDWKLELQITGTYLWTGEFLKFLQRTQKIIYPLTLSCLPSVVIKCGLDEFKKVCDYVQREINSLVQVEFMDYFVKLNKPQASPPPYEPTEEDQRSSRPPTPEIFLDAEEELSVATTAVRIVQNNDVSFLGFTFTNHHGLFRLPLREKVLGGMAAIVASTLFWHTIVVGATEGPDTNPYLSPSP
jgi:hypothetical protein